jgi:hypothetical protein
MDHQTQAARLGAGARLRALTRGQQNHRMSKEEIAATANAITDHMRVLDHADPADKAEVYAQLGLRVDLPPRRERCSPEQNPGEHVRKGRVRGLSRRLRTYLLSPVIWFSGIPVSSGGGPGNQVVTVGCVALLAVIAGTVSYLHVHLLVGRHGQPGWIAGLAPLSMDGMIVAASTRCWGLQIWPQGRRTAVGLLIPAMSRAWPPMSPWPSQL